MQLLNCTFWISSVLHFYKLQDQLLATGWSVIPICLRCMLLDLLAITLLLERYLTLLIVAIPHHLPLSTVLFQIWTPGIQWLRQVLNQLCKTKKNIVSGRSQTFKKIFYSLTEFVSTFDKAPMHFEWFKCKKESHINLHIKTIVFTCICICILFFKE